MNIYRRKPLKKVPAYTMAEVLFALAIIGIAVSIAIPIFSPATTKAKATEAQLQLKHIHNLQTQFRYVRSKYSMDFYEIDFEAPKTVKEEGFANYRYEIIQASTTSFKARAEAVVDFDGDGIVNIWEIDENGVPKEITKD
ncbi:MAG: type II secretion system protein [Bacteroidota bacterium]